jgi:DNA primase
MAMNGDSPVQQIKDKLSITEVIGGYVKLDRAGRNFRAKCPFHKEKTPSFHVSPERGTYMCFGCGEKGDIFSFVQKIEGIDFPTALRQLGERAGVNIHTAFVPKVEHAEKDERLREVCEAATKFFEQTRKDRTDVTDYLHSRGVLDETILSWRLGYAPASWRELSEHLQIHGFTKDEIVDAGLAARSEKKPDEVYDRFRGRIMFPLFDLTGRVIAFSGRFFEKVPGGHEESEPAKYVNSPETALFKKSKVLYGLDRAKNFIRKADCILLVEGQFDVVLSHQSGLPFTVALSGTALTPEHLSLLSRFSKRLVLALDADAAGLRAGQKSAAMAFAAGFDVKVPAFPEGKDPADMAKENPELLKAAIRTSRTAIEFFLDVLRSHAKDERGYKKLVEAQILPLIKALPSSIEQAHFVGIVAERLHAPEAAVRAEMARARQVFEHEQTEESTPAFAAPEMSSFDKKAGMLLFHFSPESPERDRLGALLGTERLQTIEKELEPQAELLRFLFDKEAGDHTTESTIAEDLFTDIDRVVSKERFKMKFL